MIAAYTQTVVHAESALATDSGGVVAVRPIRSMFQSDTIALRMTWGLSWALRDSRAVTWIQGP
jgi:hypothetical protein